jgi:methionine salvage enolase-phosphatase E1
MYLLALDDINKFRNNNFQLFHNNNIQDNNNSKNLIFDGNNNNNNTNNNNNKTNTNTNKNINISPDRCLVIEDSAVGLTAAKSAGMKCIITPSYYTTTEDFSNADLILPSLNELFQY